MSNPRPLSTIAMEIQQDWPRPYYGAVPYLEAMSTLHRISDRYGVERGDEIVRYFLSNAGTWQGDVARRIKTELKGLLS